MTFTESRGIAERHSNLYGSFTAEGFEVRLVPESEIDGAFWLSDGRSRLLVVDLPEQANRISPLQFLAAHDDVNVIILAQMGSLESAKLAINAGAFAYLEHSDGWEALIAQVRRGFAAPKALPALSTTQATLPTSRLTAEANVDGADAEDRECEERRRQMELMNISGLTTFAELVHGISHELNQPLAAISSFAGASARILSDANRKEDTNVRHWVDEIGAQVQRCGDIIHKLRDRLRKQAGASARSQVAVSTVVQHAMQMMQAMSGETIQIKYDAMPPELFVQANKHELGHVMTCILMNAFESIQENQFVEPRIFITSSLDIESVRIAVEDRGRGYHRDHQQQLFEPFFSTKPEHLGLGLTTSRSIVEAHDGELTVKPAHPHGTIVQITLPRLDVA